VAIGGEEYIIEPIKGHPNASADQQQQREHPHLIYKRSALSAADDEEEASHGHDDGHGTCGNDGNLSFIFFFSSSSVTA
jgi:hypothetical protein